MALICLHTFMMQVFKLTTTAWYEESFYVLTNLTEEQVRSVIAPMVAEERNDSLEEIFYSNEDYVSKLAETFPNNIVEFHQDFEEVIF